MWIFNRKLKERIKKLESSNLSMNSEIENMKDEIFKLTNRPKFRDGGESNGWYISKREILKIGNGREWRYTLTKLGTPVGKEITLPNLTEEQTEKMLLTKKIISFN